MYHIKFHRLAGLIVVIVLMVAIATPQSARAAGPWYVATTGSDGNDCLSPGTPCETLNDTIGRASAGDKIYVAVGTYINTGTEVVFINKSITLFGGWDATFTTRTGVSTIDGQATRRGIYIDGSHTVKIYHFLITNGYTTGHGGGISNLSDGTVILNNSTVSGNTAIGGGGISNNGALTLNNTTISNNTTEYNGAGIGHNGGTLRLNNSMVIGNTAVSSIGGGISNPSDGTMILNNSTVSGNTALYFGGGIHKYGPGALKLNNSTVSGNTAGENGGGIYIYDSDTLTLNNSTVSGNSALYGGGIYIKNSGGMLQNTVLALNHASASGPDCEGTMGSSGHNLVGNNSGCTLTASAGDIIGTSVNPINPGLAPLAENGGPTLTHALTQSSPAIDAGNPATCLSTDQRGVARPFGSQCDIGAYEYNSVTKSVKSIGTQDGWLLESSENSNMGGTMNKAVALLYVGDNAENKQYKSILSFNTAGLPDNAKVTSVQLKIQVQGFTGGNMFTPTKTLGNLLIDISDPYFGNSAGLVVSDFQKGASKNSVGVLSSVPGTGWRTVTLKSTAFEFINLAGTTQFRLRFQKDDNDDLGADYLKVYSGDAPAASRPQLIIEYYVP